MPGTSGVTDKLNCAVDLRLGATFEIKFADDFYNFTFLNSHDVLRFYIKIYNSSSRDNSDLLHWPERVGLHDANQNYS